MAKTPEIEQTTREQYRDAGNLNARIRLHQHFSTNPYGWYRWLIDRLQILPANARILELGCGPGAMWSSQIERIPTGWMTVLSDFSPGMAFAARANLRSRRQFNFSVLDAQRIPFPGESFEAVIANHILYHVPDRPAALSETRRILRPGGLFFAATNGQGHLAELDELLIKTVDAPASRKSQMDIMSAFSLDNGLEQLSNWFERVEVAEYEDSLAVTDVQLLIDYIQSMIPPSSGQALHSSDQVRKLAQKIEQVITVDGAFHITKRAGLFIAQKE